jgi:hypothetical protein
MKAIFAAALPMLLSTAAAASQGVSYSGNWPVTANLPPHFGNTACVTLTDNGTEGSPHSGPVTATGDMTGNLTGTFQVVNSLLTVNLESQSDNGEVVYISFIARAHNGNIGHGIFNDPGYFAVASLSFGAKGGC